MVSKVIQKRREKLRDFIKTLPPERVRMDCLTGLVDETGQRSFYENETPDWPILKQCNTVGCIAGWMGVVFPHMRSKFHSDEYEYEYDLELMGDYLGVEYSSTLFTPTGWMKRGRYSAEQVNKTLDHLVETGEVKW